LTTDKNTVSLIMPVLVICITVAVRCAAIEKSYPGGTAAFEQDAVNGPYCSDGELAVLSFMDPRSVGAFISGLEEKGLQFLVNNKAQDMVVVDQHQGPCNNCDWINFGKEDDVSFCWIGTESPTGKLAAPSWWTQDKSASMSFIPNELVASGAVTFSPCSDSEEQDDRAKKEPKDGDY
jgi:hypothetical protein